MKVSPFAILLLFVLSFSATSAQTVEKHVDDREQLWIGYFNQSRLTNRFGLWFDVHYRMTDNFLDRPFQFLLRPALTYFIKDNLRFNVGYAFAEHFPSHGMTTRRTEHRPWQQVWWSQKHPGLTTLQSIRLEQRYNRKITNDTKKEGYTYNFRVRYNFSFVIPLQGKELVSRTPFLAIADEVFLNFGDRIVYNTFDQNRFFAGLGYQFNSHLNAQFGYMNVYQQEASGNRYMSTHAIRFFVYQTFDFREKNIFK